MNVKTVLKLLIVFILTYQKTAYGQELDTLRIDTICLNVKTVEHLSKSTELYYLCKSDNEDNEEEIQLLREIIEEKQTQENLNEGLLSTFRNEIKKLRRHRTFLAIGIGGSVAAILLLVL